MRSSVTSTRSYFDGATQAPRNRRAYVRCRYLDAVITLKDEPPDLAVIVKQLLEFLCSVR